MNNRTGFITIARNWIAILAVVLLSGCANFYVDGSVKQINSSQFKKPETLHPVQMLFEFQTKGVANATATNLLASTATSEVKASGLFSQVSSSPVEGGALLSVSLNNVPVTDSTFAKGFLTGFTFGLIGTQVSDGYVCTVRYTNSVGTSTIVKQGRHAIHATLGAAASPENVLKAADATEAATIMTRQILSNVLNDLSQDANFK